MVMDLEGECMIVIGERVREKDDVWVAKFVICIGVVGCFGSNVGWVVLLGVGDSVNEGGMEWSEWEVGGESMLCVICDLDVSG